MLFMIPPIDKMDPAVLNNLVKCTQLSLSSNCIEKMVNLPNMRNLEILSLARNNIKKIGGLDEIGTDWQFRSESKAALALLQPNRKAG